MTEERPQRRRGRGLRPWLLQLKMLGLVAFLGGLGAQTALSRFGPVPTDLEGWRVLRHAVRAIFLPCILVGLLVLVLAGILLFLQMPRVFLAMRWFRLKAAALVVLLPFLHFWARGRVDRFDALLAAGRLDELPAAWDDVGVAWTVGLVAMLAVASIGKLKPRLTLRPRRTPPAAS